jgi:hypothetical protein
VILASRSEIKRGEWKRFETAAVKAAPWDRWPTNWRWCRRAGRCDLHSTPKHDWDIAAGAALVMSAGGFISTLESSQLLCNRKSPLLPGLLQADLSCAMNCSPGEGIPAGKSGR